MHTLSIIIPVYNEASTVEELLSRVWNQKLVGVCKQLLVVESNSSDGSRALVQKFCASHPSTSDTEVQLILQEKPQGKGSAVRLGLSQCRGDFILIQDGDLEYDTQDYQLVLEPLISGKANFVLGSRHLSAGSWKIRSFEKNPLKASILNFSGIILHGMFNLIYGVKLTDPTTMYKVFRRKCLEDFDLVSQRFDFDLELAGKLIRAGHLPLEVPVSYRSRGFNEGKKVRFFKDGFLCLVAMIKFKLMPLRGRQTLSPSGN